MQALFRQRPRRAAAPTRHVSSAGFVCAALGVLLAVQSCTPNEAPPELEVTTQPKAITPREAARAAKARAVDVLDKVTGGRGRLADAVKDVRLMLLAEEAEAANRRPDAVKLWFEALGLAQDRFGKRALSGWIKAYTQVLDKKTDRLVLARLILAESQGGQISPYMRAKQLTTDVALVKVLESTVPEWLLPEAGVVPTAPGGYAPPTGKSFPDGDPLLVKTTQRNCAAINLSIDAWHGWLATLDDDVRAYVTALIQQCGGQSAAALAAFKEVYPKLAKHPASQNLALEAIGRVVTLQRALGQRPEAADTYLELMKIWELPGISAKGVGLDEPAFALRRIEETLWASRYRALIGDYENGKVFAQDAISLVANAYAGKAAASAKAKEDLASQRAEAYHVLAYRIAVEQRNFESALAQNMLGLQSPYLNTEWRERLQWFAGLYDYLSGNIASSKRKWEALLATTHEDSMRAMLYFWLARAQDQLGHKPEAQAYLATITSEYPLSYYSTVAPEVAGMTDGHEWHEVFGDLAALERRLRQGGDYQLDQLRHAPALAALLDRAEILVAAATDKSLGGSVGAAPGPLRDWSRLAVEALDSAMTTELPVESHIGAYVYLSRLHFSNASFQRTIALTTKMSKAVHGFWRQWPEQILVAYPRPYAEDFARNALDNGVDKSLLLAISRQESSFTPDIRSAANAVGVMQLIQPTARRFATELGLGAGNLDELLRNPSANIRIGSRYLKVLSLTYKGFKPAIYAGYNAGEPAVDTWLQRRAHSDPLMFIELVPFGETKDYVKNVWRNVVLYDWLDRGDQQSASRR